MLWGGAAAHLLATGEFYRVRIGVGRPADKRVDLASYVLAKFPREELQVLDNIAPQLIDQILSTANATPNAPSREP